MDGTMTEPGAIDFSAMYKRNGLVGTGDILSQIREIKCTEKKERAMRIVHEEELRGCERMKLRADLFHFLATLKRCRVRLALSTRNSQPALHHFMESTKLPAGTFDPALHRDSLGHVNKPDPAVSKYCLDSWDVALHARLNGNGKEESNGGDVWFIGDSLDDMKSGKGSGCKTCLVRTSFNSSLDESSEHVDLVVDSLSEWITHVRLE
jgi:phosphoglycolate phosphatase-like HAD superfamily hydrolase